MTVKPTAPPAPHDVIVIKSSGVGMEPKKPTPAPARRWTWTRIVRYASLYYLVNVIGIGITIDGFRRLVEADDTDAWAGARARATGVIAAGNLLRTVAAAVVTNLRDTRLSDNVVMTEFFLVTAAVALYVHITMDAFGCSCPCPHQC